MSAAVATRSQQRNNLTPSRTMATGSVADKKSLKHDDSARKPSPAKQSAESRRKSPNPDSKDKTDGGNAAKPLAPPPKPTTTVSESPDYFSGLHNNTASFALEPNPFEQSFGGSGETPGKSLLPPVAALTSPASLLGGGPNSAGFSWANSLRAGPLSPAMLTGPAGGSDIFDAQFKGFPTPNESSLRTGLTPGGGGSMFPMASPNPLFNNLASGGATPGALEFHRTAMSAAAASRNKDQTSVPASFDALGLSSAHEQPAATSTTAPRKTGMTELFAHGDANDAANGLFMLAQAKPETRSDIANNINNTTNDSKRSRSGSGSEGQDNGSEGDKSEAKPVTRSRGKKQPAKKATAAAPATRRKADGPAGKGPAAKRARPSEDQFDEDDEDDEEDEDDDMGQDDDSTPHKDTRKMTDEEKRKNFLERNRVAALKCRQRKKQWLANLQSKVELYSTENDALNAQVAQLRQEVMNLKTLLLAHKDCPVTQSQGLTSMNMAPLTDFSQHPYNLAMANRAPGVMAGQNVQRRFS